MSRVDRLLCHPYRVFVNELCNVLVKEQNNWEYREGENVILPVDSLVGNPDPYVFHKPWLYGYCRNYNMPADTGTGSIIIFGTYLNKYKNKEVFLVDTVFVVGGRYDWLEEKDGYEPSQTFKDRYPYTKRSKLYNDFIRWRVEKGHHPKAKAIFEANHLDEKNWYKFLHLANKSRDTDYYSFIPLRYDNGIYKLIDILPIIKSKYPTRFDDYNSQRNRLYEADAIAVKSIEYLIEQANRLVLHTSGTGMPDKLDLNLQLLYYKQIYNITDVSSIKKNCNEICYSQRDLEDEEDDDIR